MRNRTIAMLVAAAALLCAARGELFGPGRGADARVRDHSVGVAITGERGALRIEIGNGDGRLVVTVTKEVVDSIAKSVRCTLLAAVERAGHQDGSVE